MKTNIAYASIKAYKLDEILHVENGQGSFELLRKDLEPLMNMMIMMGEVIDSSHNIPHTLILNANSIFDNFYQLIRELYEFQLAFNDKNSFDQRNDLLSRAEILINGYLKYGGQTGNYVIENFLPIYNSIMSFDNEHKKVLQTYEDQQATMVNEIGRKLDALSKEIESLESLKSKHQELINALEDKAKEKSTEEYAVIFENEANSHKEKSSIWLGGAVVIFILFLVFIRYEDFFIPIQINLSSTVTTLEYVKRLLIVSLCIYVITFIIKQYNIQKHLQTLNNHRKNTLNSYRLFLQSIGSSDQDVKNALMVEVARAIYESGQTGYINSKDDGSNNSSIMEITKFVKPND